jgi:cereblon
VLSNVYHAEMEVMSEIGTVLNPGTTHTIPIIPLENIVLCPGLILPHRLLLPTDRRAIRQALQAPAPLKRLVGIVCCHEYALVHSISLETMGCIAEIIRISADRLNILAIGRQRFEYQIHGTTGLDFSRVNVQIIGDIAPPPMPACVETGGAAFPPWAYRPFDGGLLSRRAASLLQERIPRAVLPPGITGDPLAFSYWLTGSLPVDTTQRQKLLSFRYATERIAYALDFLTAATEVRCVQCFRKLALIGDTIVDRSGVCGGIFVNSHAVVHDILVTTSADVNISGDPVVDNSWFEGFAWQVCYCIGCTMHVGWRFSPAAQRQNSQPNTEAVTNEIVDPESDLLESQTTASLHAEVEDSSFFGLRRSAFVVETNNSSAPALPFGGLLALDDDEMFQTPDSEDEEQGQRDGDGA